ncbi:MAG: Nif3-like dinuclear metal center hexameric protein [Ignavibacteriales bacterium]|nr:Nif3-like dinuclear metal center hexameric protein [Ignavibacteriales bacterium]
MSDAGAGVIGKYEECSFGASGIGTFRPSRGTKPFVGKIDQFEKVQEIKLEMIVPQWKLNNVLAAMKSAHPYEKIAYDVINLGNISHDYGVGAIGTLENKMHTKIFLKHLSRILKIPVLRFSGKTNNIIERVAVCGGGGSDLIQAAQKQGADVLVTGDISYHSFAETDHNMMIVDAGHYETEYPIVEKLVRYLRDAIGKNNSKIEIHASRLSTNTVQYFIS